MKPQELNSLASAIRSISYGDSHGPTGLEALNMAIAGAGTPGERNLLDGLFAIASAIGDLAEAVRETKAQ